MTLTKADITIDRGINPAYDADCPGCESQYDIMRDAMVGVAVKHGPRLCTDCIESVMPEAAKVLDLIADLDHLLEECDDVADFTDASVQLLTAAIEALLLGHTTAATHRQAAPPRPQKAST